ncbi:PREDICTED: serine/threonine-protein phosphatase 6 regulatory ankyrin repeat subunit A-like isoform X4 [Wasmannia auropunctata]|uniref:serine/threonine-protein phosphatase 6 regulatory ankyrin repeat subunit A-like isoform X4 n=1 Tax=Wasmannia auropunctata TaxID=64793 RepID=UPI0005EE1BE5|nr:PREDICTED: serine/threonine-protein phosphatase 6 regulatory ankyrin repeat subunit A-like isoform X4 [Wasmannia auropunctata]
MHSAVRGWLHRGELEKLENIVLEGRGSRLLGEHSQDLRTRVFLKGLPNYLTKISQVHDAIARGSLAETQKIIAEESKKKLAIAKDSCGVPLIHKAVYYDQPEIVSWLLENYPITPQQKDREGRTALHYCCACKDPDSIWDILIEGGCDASICDKKGNPASYYLEHSTEIELSEVDMTTRRRKSTAKDNMDFKPSNIRIWIHNRDIGKLQQVLWEGHGSKLRCETSNNPRIRKFLEAVPFIMGTIKDIHATVINNDLEGLKTKLDEPISPIVLCGKDSNGLNALHKAAGLGYTDVAREILERCPATVAAQDNEGKTSLHYAAALKDDGVMYDLLTEHGADESKLDNRQKAPAFYKNRPSDVDLSNLSMIPEAPRVSDTYPKNWDWRILEAGAVMRGMKKVSSDDSAFGSAESTMKDSDGSNEKQVIVGEHKEPAEVELTEGSMARDPEVNSLIENGNMEQLAALVLNGEGRRLVGRQCGNPELQTFIDNVPAYMGKIHAVHMAAREGNLRDLQSALDRRKFAVARNESSPHGATPLHVAVVFGNTAIIRYLAGRFPETANAIDLDGRTPLHYAATLADNGHYYNLLLHLGANPLIQDNFGQKADYYRQSQSDLSHKKLLRDFGASERLADEMLTDKDDNEVDIPIFRTEEGHYLAASLGDPLIKGLTEVANARPRDPITYLATYLYNFASKNKSKDQESDVLIIPDREEENLDNIENTFDDDAGYPRSPDSDIPESTFSNPNRDEHGQSMIHFAAVRSYSKDGLYHLLLETQVNVGFRDELYRTARDVAEQANIRENVEEIDRFVVYLAARGETEKLVELLLEGYDHILDAEDDGVDIIDVAAQRDHEATVQFLQSIPNYVNQREEVHAAIRASDEERAKELLNKNNGGGKLLAVGKNSIGRCALQIAVLLENEELVKFIAKTYPETLRIGDNLERTALHYAMGVPSVEVLSNLLIKAGAKRIVKDLKSRQPSYYFMNKSDIERLQEEEKSMTA